MNDTQAKAVFYYVAERRETVTDGKTVTLSNAILSDFFDTPDQAEAALSTLAGQHPSAGIWQSVHFR